MPIDIEVLRCTLACISQAIRLYITRCARSSAAIALPSVLNGSVLRGSTEGDYSPAARYVVPLRFDSVAVEASVHNESPDQSMYLKLMVQLERS